MSSKEKKKEMQFWELGDNFLQKSASKMALVILLLKAACYQLGNKHY